MKRIVAPARTGQDVLEEIHHLRVVLFARKLEPTAIRVSARDWALLEKAYFGALTELGRTGPVMYGAPLLRHPDNRELGPIIEYEGGAIARGALDR